VIEGIVHVLRRRAASSGLLLDHRRFWPHRLSGRSMPFVSSVDWRMPWDRTLFVRDPSHLPWDVLPHGFRLLDRWDVAAPLSADAVLAADIGAPGDREATRQAFGDLRVPVYGHELLFVRSSGAGPEFVAAWRDECARGGDERLAFLRALAAVHPLICALPRVWLGEKADRDALDRRICTPRHVPRPTMRAQIRRSEVLAQRRAAARSARPGPPDA